jgi:ribosomal-protein-alanine N-acetyltransferase
MLRPLGSKIIYSERFVLRPFSIYDGQMMYSLYLSDPEVCKYLEFNAYSSVDEVNKSLMTYILNYRNPFYFHWAIVDKTNGYVIGSASIHNINFNSRCGELGICISRYYWHKGVGKEVLSTIMEFGVKEVGFIEYEAYYMDGNVASMNLLKSFGFYESYDSNKIMIKNDNKFLIKKLKIKYF